MSATLGDPALKAMAGRFVWLELDFDKPENQAFISSHGVMTTPTLFVLEPGDGRPLAAHLGGMTAPSLVRVLEEGERAYRRAEAPPAVEALARGGRALAARRPAEATADYRKALALAGKNSPGRLEAFGSLTWTLWMSGGAREAAETAVREPPVMPRGESFARVVRAGLAGSLQGGDAWAKKGPAPHWSRWP